MHYTACKDVRAFRRKKPKRVFHVPPCRWGLFVRRVDGMKSDNNQAGRPLALQHPEANALASLPALASCTDDSETGPSLHARQLLNHRSYGRTPTRPPARTLAGHRTCLPLRANSIFFVNPVGGCHVSPSCSRISALLVFVLTRVQGVSGGDSEAYSRGRHDGVGGGGRETGGGGRRGARCRAKPFQLR